jgi:hypothetical protein
VSDIAPDFDFAEAVTKQAEAQQEQQPEAEVPETPEPEPEPQEAQPEPEEQPAEGQLPSEHQELIDEFGSVENALAELKRSRETVGRQGNEIGELRRMVEDVQARQNEPEPRKLDSRELEDLDPSQAVQIAWENGDNIALQRYFHEWEQENPQQAYAWRTDRQIEEMRKEFQTELQKVTEPLKEHTTNQTYQQALQGLLARYPDMQQMQTGMVGVLNQNPFLTKALESGSPEEKVQALEATYHIARSTGGAPAPVQGEQPRQTKQDAFVASQTNAGPPAKAPTEPTGESIMADFLLSDGHRMSRNWEKAE